VQKSFFSSHFPYFLPALWHDGRYADLTPAVKNTLADFSICKVVNEASFVEDLGADSLDIVEPVLALEEESDTEIPDEEAEKTNTGMSRILRSNLTVVELIPLCAFSMDDILTLITVVQAAIDHINSHTG